MVFLSILFTYQFLKQFEEAQKKLKQMNQDMCRSQNLAKIDELSAGIAHEINNPLGIMSQEIEWIQHLLKSKSFEENAEIKDLKESLDYISSQVDRCKEIIRKLLNLAKDLEPVIQCIDTNELISNIASVVNAQATHRNIQIKTELDESLPLIFTDPPLLRQVVLNLIVNAIHAVDQDGFINLITSRENSRIQIVVEDSGCGISQENINKIFTPFFSTKPQGKGTGLGLAICRGIIERLGGDINVTSEVGECTSFIIRLPIIRNAQEKI